MACENWGRDTGPSDCEETGLDRAEWCWPCILLNMADDELADRLADDDTDPDELLDLVRERLRRREAERRR